MLQMKEDLRPTSALVAESTSLCTRCKQLSQNVYAQLKSSDASLDALRSEIDSAYQKLQGLRQEAKNPTETLDEASTRAIEDNLGGCLTALCYGPGGDLRHFLKRTKRPLILRLLLGANCPVQAVRREQAHLLKADYYSFRNTCSSCILLASSLLVVALRGATSSSSSLLSADSAASQVDAAVLPSIFARHTFTPIIMAGVQMFMVLMVYFYIAMAARESVLLMNGSNIRAWWILHHYLSALMCVITLALPVDSPSVQRYVGGWLHWTIFQALIMLAQNRYQQGRMYARIALGKNSAMDVVSGEASSVDGQLLFLLPALFLLQAWQIFLGASMVARTARAIWEPEGWLDMEPHESDLRGLRGVCMVGLMGATMGVLNAVNTVSTVLAKIRAGSKQPRKRR